MRLLAALGLFVVGALAGVATIALHSEAWALGLGTAGTLAGVLAAPAGLRRCGYAVGWLLPLALAVRGRPEGDFLVADGTAGYLLVGLGLVVLCLTTATLPPLRRHHDADTGSARIGTPMGEVS